MIYWMLSEYIFVASVVKTEKLNEIVEISSSSIINTKVFLTCLFLSKWYISKPYSTST